MKPEIEAKFASYPVEAQQQLKDIRRLVFSVAEEHGLGAVEETLKWGEASYCVKGGSPIRIDWKAKDPKAIKVYFHCPTSLVETLGKYTGKNLSMKATEPLLFRWQPLPTPGRCVIACR
ncbi:hypothetical protein J2X32_002003 [Rheinheimera pacifica]|uniref:DUF1801 domain-containing protein n=1 Tax=Rheinheimera pacifica TaxID=173990 RepID=UPI00285BB5F1|nr:DUF1801 domain-containing protein [Rheinheimera pacifica]MDR6983369.1 hypothetical protein [Rheinheimera pacifica]